MELIIFLVMAAVTIIPLWTLLPKFDIHKWWSFAALIPLGLIVLLWVMAARSENMGPR
jgi:hypothetical protein